jgi:hypothetical protein
MISESTQFSLDIVKAVSIPIEILGNLLYLIEQNPDDRGSVLNMVRSAGEQVRLLKQAVGS